MESQLRKHINRSANVDEAHREEAFPDVCTPTCEHITCSYRRIENKGRPCFMKFSQYKTPPNNLIDPYGMQRQIDQALARAFKPMTDRIEQLEQKTVERRVTFNGKGIHTYTPKLLFSESIRVDRDMN